MNFWFILKPRLQIFLLNEVSEKFSAVKYRHIGNISVYSGKICVKMYLRIARKRRLDKTTTLKEKNEASTEVSEFRGQSARN
jgi:hypothetical protein